MKDIPTKTATDKVNNFVKESKQVKEYSAHCHQASKQHQFACDNISEIKANAKKYKMYFIWRVSKWL